LLWNDLAAKGKHAEAVGVENEIAALERSAARHKVQHEAEQIERARLSSIADAKSTLDDIERHKAARVELEAVVAELEAAAKAVELAIERLRPAFTKALVSWPTWRKYEASVEQEAYDETLEANKYPRFEPIRLRLRLPLVLDILRHRGNRGLNDILHAADARF
jgi:hypothetical protein